MSNHLAHRTLSALAVAATAGVLSVAPAYAQLTVPPDPVPLVSTPTPTLSQDGPEVLQIALGALGGAALAAAAAGALSRSRHASGVPA